MGGDRHCRADVLPHRHREEAHDDDIRRRRQVQGLAGLLPAGSQERGLHVPDEGSRGQHSPRRGGRGRAGWLRQVPADVHRFQDRGLGCVVF